MHTECSSENLKWGENLQDVRLDGRIILKTYLKETRM
jgi:hypothetical protein